MWWNFFEKPHAKTLEEHKYFQDLFEPYSLTIGYTRRKMGIVDSMKKILEQKIFGDLRTVKMFFGDVHYRFDTFRSNIKKSGGGIFLEAESIGLTVFFLQLMQKKLIISILKKNSKII